MEPTKQTTQGLENGGEEVVDNGVEGDDVHLNDDETSTVEYNDPEAAQELSNELEEGSRTDPGEDVDGGTDHETVEEESEGEVIEENVEEAELDGGRGKRIRLPAKRTTYSKLGEPSREEISAGVSGIQSSTSRRYSDSLKDVAVGVQMTDGVGMENPESCNMQYAETGQSYMTNGVGTENPESCKMQYTETEQPYMTYSPNVMTGLTYAAYQPYPPNNAGYMYNPHMPYATEQMYTAYAPYLTAVGPTYASHANAGQNNAAYVPYMTTTGQTYAPHTQYVAAGLTNDCNMTNFGPEPTNSFPTPPLYQWN